MFFGNLFTVRHYRAALRIGATLLAAVSISACNLGPATHPLQKTLPAILLTLGVANTVEAPDEIVPADAADAKVAEAQPAAASEAASTEADASTTIESGADQALPPDVAALLADANPAAGEKLTVDFACVVCHPLANEPVPTGSTWYNIGVLAATRVEGQSAETYLYLSIVDPNIHLVEGAQPNVMPTTYKDILTPAQFADIIAYLLTIKAE